jgi:hypothetical protein
VRLISFLKDRGSARVEVSCYNDSLKDETLIDWIRDIEIYFENENVQDPNRAQFTMTWIKGHTTLWWDML